MVTATNNFSKPVNYFPLILITPTLSMHKMRVRCLFWLATVTVLVLLAPIISAQPIAPRDNMQISRVVAYQDDNYGTSHVDIEFKGEVQLLSFEPLAMEGGCSLFWFTGDTTGLSVSVLRFAFVALIGFLKIICSTRKDGPL